MPQHFAVNPQTGERIALIDGKWVPAVQAGSSSGAPRLTEAQAKDGFNAKRMAGADAVINKFEQDGYDRGLASLQGDIDLGGLKIGNPLSMAGHKREYDAAALEWADGLLRMTTGAAATKQEMDNTSQTYFPKFGDGPAVRAQKAAARARVEKDAMLRAGPAGMGGGPPSTDLLGPGYKPPAVPAGIGGPPNRRALPGGNAPHSQGPQRLSPEQARALPPGTRFVGMDGVERVRH